jgi:hypothetical protein
MGYMLPVIFVVISIFGIALSSMIIKTTKKSKDSKYKFSVFILVTSIIGLFISGYFTFRSFQGPQAAAGEGSLPNISASIPTTEKIQTLVKQDNLRALKRNMDGAIDGFISKLGDIKGAKSEQIQARIQGLIAASEAMNAATRAAS